MQVQARRGWSRNPARVGSRVVPIVATLVALGCGGGGGNGSSLVAPSSVAASFATAFANEAFFNPLKLVQHPVDDDRWYVVEQRGRIFTLLASNPAASRSLAIDLGAQIVLADRFEEGLLGMAFAPDFATSGEVLLSYTEDFVTHRESVVARFLSTDGGLTFAFAPGNADVIRLRQEERNHNGGDIVFGPDDLLYFALGDGGGAGDPDPEDGQDVTTLFGSILRLDALDPPLGAGYGIPPDNPFVASSGADEIYAYGFRNPWRMSFDTRTDELWLGDVGQNAREEIDRVVRGGNYGWDCREGDLDFDPDPNCSPPYVEPEVVHPRSEAASITGGYVYRGSAIPDLAGAYVYGDFITGRVFAWFFDTNPPRVVELDSTGLEEISSFGQARDGELYALSFGSPSIHRLVPNNP